MLLLLRAGNCDPEKAAEVTKVFQDYKRAMLGSECSSVNYYKFLQKVHVWHNLSFR